MQGAAVPGVPGGDDAAGGAVQRAERHPQPQALPSHAAHPLRAQ